MGKRYLIVLSLLVLIFTLAACQRAKPQHVAIDLAGSLARPELQFELAQPPSQAGERTEGQTFVVTQDNCSGAGPMETIHRETPKLGPSYELGNAEGIADLSPYETLIGEIVLRRYQVKTDTGTEGQVVLRIAVQSKAEYVLRWDETWDRNTVNVVRNGQVIGTVPVRVRLGAQLVMVSSEEHPCGGSTTGTPPRVDLPIVGNVPITTTMTPSSASETPVLETPSAGVTLPARPTRVSRPSPGAGSSLRAAPTPSATATATMAGRPTRTRRPTRTLRPTRPLRPSITPRPSHTAAPSPTPTLTPSLTMTAAPLAVASPTMAEASATLDASIPRPGSAEAIALVRDYVQFLQARQWREAYNLLDISYQRRMSYDSFVRGYEGVSEIELYGIESTWMDEQRESVRALMTLRTVAGSGDWMGTYEVVRAPGQLPYERRILSSSLVRLPPEAEARLDNRISAVVQFDTVP